MAIVELLGRKVDNYVALQQNTSVQEVYSVTVPAGTLGSVNSLRISVQLSSVTMDRRPCAADTPPANTGPYLTQRLLIQSKAVPVRNLFTSWGKINFDDDSVISIINFTSPGGGDANDGSGYPTGNVFARYLNDQYQLYKLNAVENLGNNLDCTPVVGVGGEKTLTKVPSDPSNLGIAVDLTQVIFGGGPGCHLLASDEDSYALGTTLESDSSWSYFSVDSNTELAFPQASENPAAWFGNAGDNVFVASICKSGSDIYVLYVNNGFSSHKTAFVRHSMAAGAPAQTFNDFGNVTGIDYTSVPRTTASYVYMLLDGNIYRLHRSNCSTVSIITLPSFGGVSYPLSIFPVTDDFIYIWWFKSNGEADLYYWKNGVSGVTLVGRFLDTTFHNPLGWNGNSPFGDGILDFNPNTGYWYAGSVRNYSIGILKFGPAECP